MLKILKWIGLGIIGLVLVVVGPFIIAPKAMFRLLQLTDEVAIRYRMDMAGYI
jgi:hypothetical protein